jgi:thiamine biosynthesis protein ThiS
MQLKINGELKEVQATTVSDLLASFELEPKRVAVEVNTRLVKRSTFAETPLSPGDEVEIVTLVGGG